MPSVDAAPTGVAASLWGEVAWLPGPIEMLSELTRPESAAVVHWLSSVVADAAPCHRALTGVDHYFLVAGPGGEPTHVLWGDAQRQDVESCATTLRLGETPRVTREGALTHVTTGAGELWLLWMTAEGQTVVVADRDRARVDAFRTPAHPLSADAELARALQQVDRDADTWSISRQDVTSAVLGQAATIHVFSITGLTGERPDLLVRAWARFPDEAAAARSHAALDALAGALPGYQAAREGTDLTAQARPPSLAALAALRPAG